MKEKRSGKGSKSLYQGREMLLNMICALLGILVILLSAASTISDDGRIWYAPVFLLAMGLAIINAVKYYQKSTKLTILFTLISFAMLLAATASVILILRP